MDSISGSHKSHLKISSLNVLENSISETFPTFAGKLLDGAFLPEGYRVALGPPFAPAKPVLQESARTQHTKSGRSGPSTANHRKVPGTTAATAKAGRTPLSRPKRAAEHTG